MVTSTTNYAASVCRCTLKVETKKEEASSLAGSKQLQSLGLAIPTCWNSLSNYFSSGWFGFGFLLFSSIADSFLLWFHVTYYACL